MKIKIQLAAITLLLAGTTTSCIMHETLEDCPTIKELKVVSTIDLGTGQSLWPKGSSIGITVLKAGTNESFGDNVDKHYVVWDTQTGESVPNQSVEPIYLPQDNQKVDVIAYYPYAIPFDANYKVNLSVLDQSKPDLLDLITAERVCDIPSDAELIELKFFRRMTKLNFNIKLIEIGVDGNETVVNERLPGSSLIVAGMHATGVYSLPENQVTIDKQLQDIATLINKEGTASSAIVFPRQAGEGVSFVVTLPDGTQHKFLMDPKLALEAGTENRFDIVIKLKKELPAKLEYKVTYAFVDGLNAQNVTVTRGTGANAQAWPLTESVMVEAGDSFTFAYTNSGAIVKSIVVNENVWSNTTEDTPYQIANIRADQHIVFGGVDNHPVKLLVNLPDRAPFSESVVVRNRGSYKFKMPVFDSEKLIMTINGVTTEPTPDQDGFYAIDDIQSAKVIVITVKKAADAPDAFITADVHKWTILVPIDGGVILPD